MTAEKYLNQGMQLEKQILIAMRNQEELKSVIRKMCSSKHREFYLHEDRTAFQLAIRRSKAILFRISEMKETKKALKRQMIAIINSVESEDYQMLLMNKYINYQSMEDIGIIMNVDMTTLERWLQEALKVVRVPDNAISLKIECAP